MGQVAVGTQVHRWTITAPVTDHPRIIERAWSVTCACGRTGLVRDADLRAGKTRSCGCLRAERAREIARTRRLRLLHQ